MKDALGDRIKAYEEQETYARFLPNVPVVARIDGRCFSKFTKGLDRPFDDRFSHIMRRVTEQLVRETNACVGYTQSDEISLCWYTDKPGSDIFFAGRKFKMTAQLAALATAYFHIEGNKTNLGAKIQASAPTFDARVFQVPTLHEGANAFLWRQQDCRKNAISMVARTHFSHKELHGKNGRDMLSMVGEDVFNAIDWRYREGVFVRRVSVERHLAPDELIKIPPDQHPTGPVWRTDYQEFRVPLLSEIANPVGVVFYGEDPVEK